MKSANTNEILKIIGIKFNSIFITRTKFEIHQSSTIFSIRNENQDIVLNTIPMLMKTDVLDSASYWHIFNQFTIAVTLLILFANFDTNIEIFRLQKHVTSDCLRISKMLLYFNSTLYPKRNNIFYWIPSLKREERRRKEALNDLFIWLCRFKGFFFF